MRWQRIRKSDKCEVTQIFEQIQLLSTRKAVSPMVTSQIEKRKNPTITKWMHVKKLFNDWIQM